MIVGTPIAWWLARTRHWLRQPLISLITLPLVLPPTVLGFYLLVLMGPDGPIGKVTSALGLGTLSFSFSGLVLASMIHSLPFVIQPLQNAFETMGNRPMEVAATLGASPWERFFTIAVPLARPGFLTAAVLCFAHTLGEFGIVMMIGGNIEGETKVLSVAIFEHVEATEYGQAHILAGGMLLFSFLSLMTLYFVNGHLSKKERS
jgi:molybdate transport system permease protein